MIEVTVSEARERLADLLGDAAFRERLGRQARAVAQGRFGVERVAGEYYALYQCVLEGAHAQPSAFARPITGQEGAR